VDVLSQWVEKLGDTELLGALKAAHFVESSNIKTDSGRVVYAEAIGNIITVYKDFNTLSVGDKLAVLSHELGHLTKTNIDMGRTLSSGDYMFRTSKLLSVESNANQSALRILNAGRGVSTLPEIIKYADK
jgi:hypothetical protein